MVANQCSRRALVQGAIGVAGSLAATPTLVLRALAATAHDEALIERFVYLNANGNSNCSGAFLDSIATMRPGARLQGSCCAPMDAHRYTEQVKALAAYADISSIPPDPYDIDAKLAHQLTTAYELALSPSKQVAYDYAMENSDERGPCCCGCWRWYVYGGLANRLIRDHGFTGEQVKAAWNLSNGCGGGAEHNHS